MSPLETRLARPRLRVALTHEHSWPDVRRGGERYLHELAAALARRGHDVTILAGALSSGRRREDGVRVVRIARRAGYRRYDDASFFASLVARLAAGSFDVVHSLGPRDAVASLTARRIHRRRVTVYTNLGNPVKQWWDEQRDGRSQARVVREIDVYGCLSGYALSMLETTYGRNGVLTPGGVRLATFRPTAEREPVPTLLYSGVLDDPRKGVATLLEAVSILARREPRVRLWLSGPGDPGPLLRAAPADACARTDVLPLGAPGDQPARYSAAWATVLPSIGEAFGLALVESLACGTPIVAASDAGLPELVKPGIGALGKLGDAASLAAACADALALASDVATREQCRESARAFDWDEKIAPAVEDIYRASAR